MEGSGYQQLKKQLIRKKGKHARISFLLSCAFVLLLISMSITPLLQPMVLKASPNDDAAKVDEIERIIIDSPPHPTAGIIRPTITEAKRQQLLDGKDANAVMLSDVPTSTWTYGCSATAAGMLFGYYDRIGYENMYTGPTNSGVCPLTNLGQGIDTANPLSGSCHIIATQKNHDGIIEEGHVDDYWDGAYSPGPDPWTSGLVVLSESFEDGVPPAGWTTTGWLDSLYGSACEGTAWAYSWSAGDELTTPTVTFEDETVISFQNAVEGSTHPMDLEVWLDYGTASEELIWSDYGYTHVACELNEIILGSSYAGDHTITWLGLTSDFYGQILDDIVVTTAEEHQWGDCVADFMGTNQWKWDLNNYPNSPDGSVDSNIDGGTSMFTFNAGSKYYDPHPSDTGYDYGSPDISLCSGIRDFAEARGYTVLTNYNQLTNTLGGTNNPSIGFSFADFKDEIDNGYPVLVHVTGHTMLGVGYNESTNEIYIHDTWDNEVHKMTWGGSYSGMDLFAVTVIHLEPLPEPTIPLLSWYPNVQIPTESVTMNVTDGIWSYFDVNLTSVPSGYHIGDGMYPGWCFEKSVQMTRGMKHPVRLCHSYDPNMPAVFQGVNWSVVNYIVNQNESYNKTVVQDAIWNITEGEPLHYAASASIVENATQFGSGFTPSAGDYVVVLVYLDPAVEPGYDHPVQNCFIRVPLSYTGCNASFWSNNHDEWPSEFAADDLVGNYFDLPKIVEYIEDENLSDMLEGSFSLSFDGLYKRLVKEAIAGMLNANHEYVSYPISYDQLIVSVHEAFPYPAVSLLLGILLEEYNQIGCNCMEESNCPCCE